MSRTFPLGSGSVALRHARLSVHVLTEHGLNRECRRGCDQRWCCKFMLTHERWFESTMGSQIANY